MYNFVTQTNARKHPFNLKRGGAMFFFRKKFMTANLMKKRNSVSDFGRNKSSESTLCLIKINFVENK